MANLEVRRAQRYDISTLLQMRNTTQVCPINRLKLNPEAPPELIVGAHPETVEMRGALQRSFSMTSRPARQRYVNKRSDKLSLASLRERPSKINDTKKKTSDIGAYDGFARFLKEHNSPRNKRVTAGGRLVSAGCNSPPPTFDVDHINRMVEQAEKRVQIDSPLPEQTTEPMPCLIQEDGRFYDDTLSQYSVNTRRRVQAARDELLSKIHLLPGWKTLAFIDEGTVLISTGPSSKTMYKACLKGGETKYELIPPPQSTFDSQSKQRLNFGFISPAVEIQNSSGSSNIDPFPTTDEPSNSTRLTSVNSASTQLGPGQSVLGSSSIDSSRPSTEPVAFSKLDAPQSTYHKMPLEHSASLEHEMARLRAELIAELEILVHTKSTHIDLEQNFKRIEHHLALHEAHISHHEVAALLAQKKVLIPEIDRLRKVKTRSEDKIHYLEKELAMLAARSVPPAINFTDDQEMSGNLALRSSRQSRKPAEDKTPIPFDQHLDASGHIEMSDPKCSHPISALNGLAAHEVNHTPPPRTNANNVRAPGAEAGRVSRQDFKHRDTESSDVERSHCQERQQEQLSVRRARKRRAINGSSRADILRQELLDPKCWSLPSKYKPKPGQKPTFVSELARAFVWKPLDSELIPDFLDRYCEQSKILDRFEDMVKDQERKQAVGIDTKAGSKLDTAVMPDMVRTAMEGSSLTDTLRHRYVTSYLANATGNTEFQALRVPTSAYVPSYQQPMRTANIADTTSRKPTNTSTATMIGNTSAPSRHNVGIQQDWQYRAAEGIHARQAEWHPQLVHRTSMQFGLAGQQMANQQMTEILARNEAHRRLVAGHAWRPDIQRMPMGDLNIWVQQGGQLDPRFWQDPRMQSAVRYGMV